jgi:uncharacterized membrane protein
MVSLLHVLAGATGLLVGPIVLWAPKRRGIHTALGTVYLAIVATVCISAAILAVLRWSTRWWFLPIAIGTFACAAIAYWAARRRPRGWLIVHVGAQIGSYTGMTTAFVVNNWEGLTGVRGVTSPLAFLIPMSLGTAVGVWLMWQVHAGRRPRPLPLPSSSTTI